MGTYTQIYDSTRSVAVRRGIVGVSRGTRAETERDATPFAYTCPRCGDGSAVATSCPRCDVELLSTARTIRVPSHVGVREPLVSKRAWAIMLGLVANVVPAVLWWISSELNHRAPSLELPVMAVLAIAVVGPVVVLGPLAALHLAKVLGRRRARRSELGAAQERADSLASGTPTTAPNAHTLVRLAGSARVADGVLFVCDESGRARIPVGRALAVYADDRRQDTLSDGDTLEVVGFGARELGAGDGYRDTYRDFVFDASKPIDVFLS